MARSGWRYGQAMAAAVRQQLGLDDQPVDVWRAVRERGAYVARPDFGLDGPDGLYVWKHGSEGRGLVTVNRGKEFAQQLFTAAHELGHHEMHRDAPAGIIVDVSVFGSRDEREQEANAFAGYLMAPDEGLRRLLDGRRDANVTPDVVAEAVAEFGISYQATLYRLHNAGFVRAVDRDRLAGGGGFSVGYLLEKAGARPDSWAAPEPAIPPQLQTDALELYRRAAITLERLADILQVSVEEAVAFAEERGMNRDKQDFDEDAALALLADE